MASLALCMMSKRFRYKMETRSVSTLLAFLEHIAEAVILPTFACQAQRSPRLARGQFILRYHCERVAQQ